MPYTKVGMSVEIEDQDTRASAYFTVILPGIETGAIKLDVIKHDLLQQALTELNQMLEAKRLAEAETPAE